MRETAEALDDLAVLLRVAELLVIAELAEVQHGPVLVLESLAVLERHVKERALLALKLLVAALVDRAFGGGQREMIGRELLGLSTEHVARKLVEEDHSGECGQRIGQESLGRQLALFQPELE